MNKSEPVMTPDRAMRIIELVGTKPMIFFGIVVHSPSREEALNQLRGTFGFTADEAALVLNQKLDLWLGCAARSATGGVE